MFCSSKLSFCKRCGIEFKIKGPVHIFCSRVCQNKFWVENNLEQYNKKKLLYKLDAENNWERWIKNLIYKKTRRHLNIKDLLLILEKQDYKCALSGVNLTCKFGEKQTNLSIDRINKDKGYTLENIRFVCLVPNVMKWILSDVELYDWCEKILKHREEKYYS